MNPHFGKFAILAWLTFWLISCGIVSLNADDHCSQLTFKPVPVPPPGTNFDEHSHVTIHASKLIVQSPAGDLSGMNDLKGLWTELTAPSADHWAVAPAIGKLITNGGHAMYVAPTDLKQNTTVTITASRADGKSAAVKITVQKVQSK